MRSTLGGINIAASAQKVDVDNRISLRYYYRIADNILKQADIFREEENFIDLYVMLLRFSSLIYETIPRHRDYKASPQSQKKLLKKRLLNAVNELEELKPKVAQKIDELYRKNTRQANGRSLDFENNSLDSSHLWPRARRNASINHETVKVTQLVAHDSSCHGSGNQLCSNARPGPVLPQFQRFSLSMPRPKEETLSKHSILGSNGLLGQWQPPMGKVVQYPSNIDLSPVEIPSLQQPVGERPLINKSSGLSDKLESILTLDNNAQKDHSEEPLSLISFETTESLENNIIRQPSPPPVLADVHDLVPAMSPQVTRTVCESEKPLPDDLVYSESPLQLHISTAMMDNFMQLAKSNTDKNLETCGILAGLLKNRKFYVTTLIIPKQESTSDSCHATNEEEIFEVQCKQSLFPLGWIHTHPSQSCFMSSVDVHTHYSYQLMLPEAVAIVMAPKDASRSHGIFRLTAPGGMSVIRQCEQRGFHSHDLPPDGGSIYKQCTDVYVNPNLKFDVVDLRSS